MTLISRRGFLHSVAATAAAHLRARQRPPTYPISFSTLGCPKWPWTRILEQAASLGYAAIELRGIEGEMDLTKRTEFIGAQTGQTRKDLAALNLKISDLGASSRMHEADPKVRAAQLDEGRRFIDLANRLSVPYVRVFGDKVPPGKRGRRRWRGSSTACERSASTRKAAASPWSSNRTATSPTVRRCWRSSRGRPCRRSPCSGTRTIPVSRARKTRPRRSRSSGPMFDTRT